MSSDKRVVFTYKIIDHYKKIEDALDCEPKYYLSYSSHATELNKFIFKIKNTNKLDICLIEHMAWIVFSYRDVLPFRCNVDDYMKEQKMRYYYRALDIKPGTYKEIYENGTGNNYEIIELEKETIDLEHFTIITLNDMIEKLDDDNPGILFGG